MNYKHYRRTLEDSNDLSKDEIPGGLAEGKKPSDFPKLKINQGKKVEMEHTSDPKVAEEIAMDHLTEDPKYYEKLKTIEKNYPIKPNLKTPKIGYNAQDVGSPKWLPLEYIKDTEVHERGNPWFDDSQYLGTHEAMWVTHKKDDASFYGSRIHNIDLTGAKPVIHDGDGGYLYVRPKKEGAVYPKNFSARYNPSYKKSEPLQKMSRPRLSFPGLPKVSTRPDQDVQVLETGRQKELYGRKVGNAVVNEYANSKPGTLKDKKPHFDMAAKRTAGKFDRTTLGLNQNTKDQSYSAALAGKLRSKFEEGDEVYDQKLEAHKQAIKDSRDKYFSDLAEWKKQAESLPQGSNAYWEHVANRPKYKKPRKPAKSLKATKDLSPDQMKRRGNATEATIEHEGFHNIMDQVEREYGGRAAHIVKEKILASHDKEALSHVASYIKNRLGYKPQSGHFEEEVLAHARDILVNPDKRKKFEEFVGSDKSRDIMNKLKTGHQRAYDFSQSVTPQSLEQEDMKQFPVPTKLAASEEMNKAPLVDEANENINWPYHPKDEGKYVKTMTHKDSGHKIHVVHMMDRDEDKQLHTGSIYYITENGKPNGKPIARTEVGHLNPETGEDFDPHFKAALTEPEYRGKGLNTTLHLAALKDYKKLKSDYRLSPGSQKTYEKLSHHPNVKAKLMPTDKVFQQKFGNQTLNVFPQDTQHELKWKKPTKLAASEPLNKAPLEYTSGIMQEMPPKEPKKGNFSKVHEKVLPNGLIYKQYSKGDTSLHQIYHPQHEGPVAEVTTRAIGNPDPSAVQDHKVTWSQVHPEHKGKGFGKIAYKAALMHGKGVGRLMSDQLTSRQAESAWDHLQQQPGVKVKRGKWLASTPRYTKEQDEAISSQHSAIIPVKSAVDEKAMFPDVGVGQKKLAASEGENE